MCATETLWEGRHLYTLNGPLPFRERIGMKKDLRWRKMVFGILACLSWMEFQGDASEKALPLFKGKQIVALVQGEPITLEEFDQERKSLPQKDRLDEKTNREAISALLRRMINSRLIVQEAKRMGLDELPEIKREIESFSRIALREELIERQLRRVKADEKEVERLYREYIKEWKVKSILFRQEDPARKMEQALADGKPFDVLARQWIEAKVAEGKIEAEYLNHKQLLPEVSAVLSRMKMGAVSPRVKIKDGYVFLKLEGLRYPEDPEVKERVRKEATRQKQSQSLVKYEEHLRRTYAKVDEALLKDVDFEASKPGFDALLKDRRILAEIRGESPITVGDLAEDLRHRFYHGVQRAIERKRLNQEKQKVFEDLLRKRLLRKEALRLGLDKTDAYRRRVKDHENSLLFGTFVQKVIASDVRLREDEVKSYYENHRNEFTYPEMMRLWDLAFAKRKDAEKALTLLRQGTAFQWAKSNLDGQLERGSKNVLNFDGKLLTTHDLPPEVRRAISGARAGDFRLYESSEGYFYVLLIEEVLPPRPQSYPEVKESIARKIFDEKLKVALEEYAAKLWAASDVEIYLKP